MGVPFGGVPFGIGRPVGSSGKPYSPTAIQIRPLRGRCSPHAVQGQQTLTTQRDDAVETSTHTPHGVPEGGFYQ